MPGGVAQPFAVIPSFTRVNTQQVVSRALHTVRHRKNRADVGINRLLCRQGQMQANHPRFIEQNDMQGKAKLRCALVAAPQGEQASAAIRHILADGAQVVVRDGRLPDGQRAWQFCQL